MLDLLLRMDLLLMMVDLKHFVNTVAIKAPLTQVLKHDVCIYLINICTCS